MKRTPLKPGKPLQRRTPLRRGKPLERGRPLKATRRRETAAERRARKCFEAVVCHPEQICFFADVNLAGEPRRPGHECYGDLDPHHLIRKSWIQDHFCDLPEDELEIKYAPIIGCPLCRGAHDALPANLNHGDRVFYEELDPDLIDLVRRVDRRYARRGRPSMETRLELECPRREAIA